MVYNLTNVTAANDVYHIVKATNELSGGVFLALFILIVFLGYIMIFYRQNMKITIMGASFFALVISVIAFSGGWVGTQFVLVPAVVFFGALLSYYFLD